MGRKIEQISRNRKKRNSKSIILLGLEGKNKTEKLYFQNYISRDKSFNIIISPGNDTDPLNIYENLKKYMTENDINSKNGDKIFCVFDSDVNDKKQLQIDEVILKSSNDGIDVIMSVPSFEIWYLLHYNYTTHQFLTNKELITYLEKNIGKYNKNINIYNNIFIKTEEAIKNSKKLKKYHNLEDNDIINNIKYNPSTDIYKIIEYINKLKNNN